MLRRRGRKATEDVPELPWRGHGARALLFALILIAAAAVLGSSAAPGTAQSSRLGDENSWIRIQNVGNQAANVEIDYHNAAGAIVASEECPRSGGCPAVRAGLGRSFFQQTFDQLPRGYRGSAYISADQPFTALLARDILEPDGTFRIAGDSLRIGTGTSTHFLPWVVNETTYVSRIVIENTSEDDYACVEIAYYADGQSSAATVSPSSGGSGCPNGGERIAPRGTMIRDETNIDPSFGFNGSAIVRARETGAGVSAGSQQLQVVVDTRDRGGAGLASYRGIGSDEVAEVVLLPMVDRNATEGQSRFTTRFRMMSATPGTSTEVTLLFAGRDGSGNQVEIEHTVTVSGSRTCDQASNGAAGCLPSDKPLPSTFTGTVRMQSVEPIAVVAQRTSNDGSLADYRGFTADDASTQVVLPVLNKNYGPFGGSRGWNSWFRVQTFDGSNANVYVVYYSGAFQDGLYPPGATNIVGSRTFRQWENRQLPDAWVGTGVVVSDRPVVVIANLESDVFDGDPVMLYNGVPLE